MDEISSAELTEWMLFEQLEPFGQPWEAKAFGQICAVDANVNRKKGARVYKWNDFFHELEGENPANAVEAPRSIWAKAALITEAYKTMEGRGR